MTFSVSPTRISDASTGISTSLSVEQPSAQNLRQRRHYAETQSPAAGNAGATIEHIANKGVEQQIRSALQEQPPPSYEDNPIANRHIVSLPGRIFCSLMRAFPCIVPYGIYALPSGPTWKVDTRNIDNENKETFINGIATHLGIETGSDHVQNAKAVLQAMKDALKIARIVSTIKDQESKESKERGKEKKDAIPAGEASVPNPEEAQHVGENDGSQNFEYIDPKNWRTTLNLSESQDAKLKMALKDVHLRILLPTEADKKTTDGDKASGDHKNTLVLDFGGASTRGDLWQIFCSVLGGKGHVFRAADAIAEVLCEMLENNPDLQLKLHGQSLGASVAEYLVLAITAYCKKKNIPFKQPELLMFDSKQLNHTLASAALDSPGTHWKKESEYIARFLNTFPLADWALSRLWSAVPSKDACEAMEKLNGLVLTADVEEQSHLCLMDLMREIGIAHPPAVLRLIVDLPSDQEWGKHPLGYHRNQAYRGSLMQMMKLIESLYPEAVTAKEKDHPVAVHE